MFFEGSAGADIDKIAPVVKMPSDFDEYWAKEKKRLAETPVALISGLVLISPNVLTKASNSLMPMPARRSGRRYRTLVQISAMVFVIGVPVIKTIRPFRSWMAFAFR